MSYAYREVVGRSVAPKAATSVKGSGQPAWSPARERSPDPTEPEILDL